MTVTPDLSGISFAYPGVAAEARATIARALTSAPSPPSGTFVLATCLRAEVVVHGDRATLDGVLTGLFGSVPELPGAVVRSGGEATAHLFRVAAGLESPVRGEVEILTQFRQAVRAAKNGGGIDGGFSKLLETAVASAREARAVLPTSPHDSIAAVAAQVTGCPERVAVLGNGAMAAAVVEAMRSLPAPPAVTVVARTTGAGVIPGVEEWALDRAGEALATFPVVVSATSAKRRLLPDAELAAAVSTRATPLLIIDMAMPPDFAPPAGGAWVRYVGIDDLAALAGRRHHGDEASDLVAKRAEAAYARFSGQHRVGSVIERMVTDADEVVAGTVARFAGRLHDRDDEAVLRQVAHTVSRTLLAGPLGYLNRSRSAADVDIIAAAFDTSGTEEGDGGG